MVNTRMEKLELGVNAMQKQIDEEKERTALLITSIAAINESLARIESRLDTVESGGDSNRRDHRREEEPGSAGGGRNRERHHDDASEGVRADGDASLGNRRGRGGELWRKIEIPLFFGEEAYAWVDRMERYFEVRGVPEDQWLYVAKIAMEGKALPWYRWWEENTTFHSPANFKKAVVKRFQPELVHLAEHKARGFSQRLQGEVRDVL